MPIGQIDRVKAEHDWTVAVLLLARPRVLEAIASDDFLLDQLHLAPAVIVQAVRAQAAATGKPPHPALTVLQVLASHTASASGPRSKNWYTTNWSLSPNRSRGVRSPDAAVKVYAPNATIGNRCRRAASGLRVSTLALGGGQLTSAVRGSAFTRRRHWT